jgi:SagB-type dehydrogenase family enzyme
MAAKENMATFRTHPYLLICPRKIETHRAFAIDLKSTEPAFIVEDPLLVWALTALPESFTKEEAMAVWSREEKAADFIEVMWEFSIGESLILDAKEADTMEERFEMWKMLNWNEAGVYHEGTRDYPFVDMSHKGAFVSDNERMKNYEQDWTAPDVYQEFSSVGSVPLQKVDETFENYLKTRKQSPDKFKDLSLLFDFCFGERLRLDHAFDEQEFLQLESLRKTIPSGGGRHPTEVFFAVKTEQMGVAPGLYHYNVKHNRLDLLRGGELFADIEKIVKLPDDTRAVLFFSSLCERAMWRYRDPRSWRAFVIDIGHAEHMCGEVSNAIDYSLTCCHHFDADAAARFIGTDPFRQPIMSIASLSSRPEGL